MNHLVPFFVIFPKWNSRYNEALIERCHMRRKNHKKANKLQRLITFTKDWYWFLVKIKANEFHPSLNLNHSNYMKSPQKETIRVTREREKAHYMDMKWTKFKRQHPRIFK